MKSVALHNLGCKVNSYELDVMQQMLQEKGYKIVPFDTKADIYIVNTCTVTNIADRKSRQMLHKAKKMNPESVVVATGCYVQTDTETVVLDECIDLAIGNNRKKDLVEILETFLGNRQADSRHADSQHADSQHTDSLHAGKEEKTLGNTTVLDMSLEREYERLNLEQTAEHTRAYIKIQDGCNQFCTYCIIPYARGRVRSRDSKDILEEITGLQKAGFREIVLTGIHISSYGEDLEKRPMLLELIQKIHQIQGIDRIRIGSLEPRIVTREFAQTLSGLPKVCPHFHLSLQSGCNTTLARMNRRYSVEEYAEGVRLLREAFGNPAITTDVITGFPGETEEEFAVTRTFLEETEFFEMHIFPYSRRKGTKAADMKDQIPEQIKKARSAILLDMEKVQSLKFRRSFLGKQVGVLFEEGKEIGGCLYQIGHTPHYVKVAVLGETDLSNSIHQVKAVKMLTDDIILGEFTDQK